MLEVIVFAVVLVAAQMLGGFAMMHIMFSRGFMKYYTKKMTKMVEEIQEEMMEEHFKKDEEA